LLIVSDGVPDAIELVLHDLRRSRSFVERGPGPGVGRRRLDPGLARGVGDLRDPPGAVWLAAPDEPLIARAQRLWQVEVLLGGGHQRFASRLARSNNWSAMAFEAWYFCNAPRASGAKRMSGRPSRVISTPRGSNPIAISAPAAGIDPVRTSGCSITYP